MRRQPKNKTNPFTIILIIALLAGGAYLVFKPKDTIAPQVVTPVVKTPTPISISEVKITKEYYTGTRPEILGDSALASAARTYVAGEIATFEADANEQVPDMRKQFGADSPTGQYTIDIKGTYEKGDGYDSIILDEYLYTGGANGMSLYKVFTANHETGVITSITDVVPTSQQSAFVAYVKKKLLTYNPEGVEGAGSMVFKEDVAKLTIASLQDWSIDADAMTIYFDKYAVAPGATGPIALHLPRAEVNKYLK